MPHRPSCGYNEGMVRAEHVIDSWHSIRQDTATAVAEFPAGEFDYRPAAELQTFGQIAHHILVSSHALTGMLLAGETDFTGPDFRARVARQVAHIPAVLDQVELIRQLGESAGERAAQFVAQTPEFWAGMIKRMDGAMVTRLEMLQTIKEHELTHRQQLFTYLRMKGIVPATTRRRLARQAASK